MPNQLYKDSYFSIAQGEIGGHSVVHKFGLNPDVDTGGSETVWSAGGLYPWSSWATAATVQIPAVNGSDNGKTVVIEGLDGDYDAQTEEITVSSSGVVAGSKTWGRIYRAYVKGSSVNVGDILIQKSSVTVAQIDSGEAQTLMGIYTVPAGHTAYLISLDTSCQKNKGGQLRVYKRDNVESGAWRIQHTAEMFENTYRYDWLAPVKFTEKTDIDVVVENADTNNTRVSTNFTLILVENGTIG